MARALLALLWALRAPPVLAKRPNILFLMTDSMDGRVLDPGAVQSQAVELPFLRDSLLLLGSLLYVSYKIIITAGHQEEEHYSYSGSEGG